MDINKRIIYSKDKKIFKISKNDDYFSVVSRKLVLLYKIIGNIGVTDNDIYQKIFGFPTKYRPFYNSQHGIYYNKKSIQYEEKQILKKILKDPEYLKKIAKKCEMDGNRVLNFSKRIKKTGFSKKTDKQIKNIIKKFLRPYIEFTAYIMPILSVQDYLEKNIKERIKKSIKNRKLAEEYFNNLTTPIKHNFGYFEQIEILKLTIFYKSNKNQTADILERKINKYLIDFSSIGVKYGIGKLWTEKDVIERIVYLSKKDPDKKLQHLQNLPKLHQRKINSILKEIKADNNFKKFLKIARTYIYLRTYRTDIISNAFANIFPAFKEIAKRNNVELEDILKCLFDEVINFNIPDRDFLNLRNKTILIRSINGKAYYIYGKQTEELTNNIKKSIVLPNLFKKDQGDRKKAANVLIRGTVANRGYIKGKVRIVLDNSQLYKVLEGDIIVAFMTTPDFVPAMGRKRQLL